MNLKEENIQKYQLFQDNISYILSTSLIGINIKLACYRFQANINPNIIYSSIYTIEQLKQLNLIFQIAYDCEEVQWIFEEVILAKSVGILEYNSFLDLYLYMSIGGRKAKVILRLKGMQIQKISNPNIPNINNINNNINMNEYQKNQERLSKLQYDANQLINEQNFLRKQLNMFFGENENNNNNNHERSRSTNQNDKYYNNLNQYNNYSKTNNMQNNNMINLKKVQINNDEDNNEEDDDDIYEVPPTYNNE